MSRCLLVRCFRDEMSWGWFGGIPTGRGRPFILLHSHWSPAMHFILSSRSRFHAVGFPNSLPAQPELWKPAQLSRSHPAIPHQQRPPAGSTRSYKTFKLFAHSFRQQLIIQCCVTAGRLKSVARMGTEQYVLTAKKACTRCSTQKRRFRSVDSVQSTRTTLVDSYCKILLTRTFVDSVKHASMNFPGCRPRNQLSRRSQGQSYFSAQGHLQYATSRTPSSKNLGPSHRQIPSQPIAEKSSHGSQLFRYLGYEAGSH